MRGCFVQRCPNGLNHGVNVLQHLIVPKSEDPKASFVQSPIANTIMFIVLARLPHPHPGPPLEGEGAPAFGVTDAEYLTPPQPFP
jgi:hypothetical protein